MQSFASGLSRLGGGVLETVGNLFTPSKSDTNDRGKKEVCEIRLRKNEEYIINNS